MILVTLGSILVTLGPILVILGPTLGHAGVRQCDLGGLDGHLGALRGLLGSTFEVLGVSWESLWAPIVDFGWKCRVLSNVLKTIVFCWFFKVWRVSGETWMVTLCGLGCKVAAWGAAWRIPEASWAYLEAPWRQGSCWGRPQILGPSPGEGKMFVQWPYSNKGTSAVSLETVGLDL